MATTVETVSFIVDQLAPLDVRTRAMFGEYALYCDEKVVALICDDTVYLKPSQADLEIEPVLAAPYPGAKDYLVIDAEILEDPQRFQQLVQDTADALPIPKPKRKRAPKPHPGSTRASD